MAVDLMGWRDELPKQVVLPRYLRDIIEHPIESYRVGALCVYTVNQRFFAVGLSITDDHGRTPGPWAVASNLEASP